MKVLTPFQNIFVECKSKYITYADMAQILDSTAFPKKNLNKMIIAHLNINLLRNKSDSSGADSE